MPRETDQFSERLRHLETVELLQTGNGIPAHNAAEGVIYWDFINDNLYVNDDGAAGWTLIGGAGALIAGDWLDLVGVTMDFEPDNPAVIDAAGEVTEYATIQAAITAAGAGEWVVVPPGTYAENLTLKADVPVTELFRHTVIIAATTGMATVITGAAGDYFICVHEIRMVQSKVTTANLATWIYAVQSATTGTLVVIADLYCHNTNNAASHAAAVGLHNNSTGVVTHIGDVECRSDSSALIEGDSYGAFAVRNESTGTITGKGDITTYCPNNAFGFGLYSQTTGDLLWRGDIDVHTLGALGSSATGLRNQGGDSDWRGWMNIEATNEHAYGVEFREDGGDVTGTGKFVGKMRVEAGGVGVGIYLNSADHKVECVIDWDGTIDVVATSAGAAYGIFITGNHDAGTIELHADVTATSATGDAYGISVTRAGGRVTFRNGSVVASAGGAIEWDLYRTYGTLETYSVQYNTHSGTIVCLLEIMGNSIWRLGEEVLNLDFTGLDWNTKAECNAVGLRFSDSDTPFPSVLYYTLAGTWTHVAGKGWQPASGVDAQGPALLIPIMRPGNWELALGVDLSDAVVAQESVTPLGYLANSNHIGALARIDDFSAVAVRYRAELYTNDGDDTWTQRYSGANLDGAAAREIRFRCQNGCVGVWDDQDNLWHWYMGRQNAGIGYTAAHAFIQVRKVAGAVLNTMYLSWLRLTYLL